MRLGSWQVGAPPNTHKLGEEIGVEGCAHYCLRSQMQPPEARTSQRNAEWIARCESYIPGPHDTPNFQAILSDAALLASLVNREVGREDKRRRREHYFFSPFPCHSLSTTILAVLKPGLSQQRSMQNQGSKRGYGSFGCERVRHPSLASRGITPLRRPSSVANDRSAFTVPKTRVISNAMVPSRSRTFHPVSRILHRDIVERPLV